MRFAKELTFFSKHSLVKSVSPHRMVVKVVIFLLFQKAVNVTFMFNLEIEFEWKKVGISCTRGTRLQRHGKEFQYEIPRKF